MRTPILCLWLALSAVDASAAVVSLRLDPTALGATQRRTAVTVTARPLAGGEPQTLDVPLAGGDITLAPGAWELEVTTPGLWSAPIAVDVKDGAPTATSLQLFTAGQIEAEVPAIASAPDARLHLQPAPDAKSLPATSVACPIREHKLACRVPAGVLDVSLRVPGYVSLFRWSLDVKPNAPTSLGKLALQRGSSLTGIVLGATDQPIVVSLEPKTNDAPNAETRARLKTTTMTVNKRRFFHFAAQPGLYTVQARSGTRVSDPVEVRVVDGRESSLRDPLMLLPPRTLTINVQPPVDPFGKQWFGELEKLDHNSAIVSSVVAPVGTDGRWTQASLTPGHYAFLVRRSPKDSWYREEFDLGDDAERSVSIDFVDLLGRLSLAGKPIPATIWFGGKDGETRIAVRPKPDGSFHALLPAGAEQWPVSIECEDPRVNRTLQHVTFDRGSDGRARLELDLPGNTITGQVIDAAGRRVDVCLVNVMMPDGTKQQLFPEGGSFSLSGVPPGKTALTAESRDGATEAPVIVDLADSNEPSDVTLIVKPADHLAGTVRSAYGPLGGATISAVPVAALQYATLSPFPTDDEGHFDLPMPPGTGDVLFLAGMPGYATRMFRTRPQAGNLAIVLEPSGGRLTITAPNDRKDAQAFLIHDHAAFGAGAVAWLTGGQWRHDGARDHVTLDPIAPGAYSLCQLTIEEVPAASYGQLPADRCTSGVLPAGGSLDLTITAP
jgi:hypothetical protein